MRRSRREGSGVLQARLRRSKVGSAVELESDARTGKKMGGGDGRGKREGG